MSRAPPEPGALVRLKPRECADSIGIDWTIRGGEARVVRLLESGAIMVEMLKTGRVRNAMPDELVIHRTEQSERKPRAPRAHNKEDRMAARKKKAETSTAPDMALAKAEAEPIIAQVKATAEFVEKVEPFTTAAQVKWAVGATAEIKREAKRVQGVIDKFVGPSKAIIQAANEVFGPALVGLEAAEDALKARILAFVERSEPERMRLLTAAGEARADQTKAAELIAQADSWAVPDVPGFAVVERSKVEVKDAAAFVAWAIENKREDLLVPNTKALTDLYEAGDMRLPGVERVRPRHIQITEAKVVAS